jgi:lysophosphatidate acyltransferase
MVGWILRPIAAVSAIAVSTLGLLSTRYQKARFYLNLGLYSGTLGVWSVWGVVVSILATAVGQVSCLLQAFLQPS